MEILPLNLLPKETEKEMEMKELILREWEGVWLLVGLLVYLVIRGMIILFRLSLVLGLARDMTGDMMGVERIIRE